MSVTAKRVRFADDQLFTERNASSSTGPRNKSYRHSSDEQKGEAIDFLRQQLRFLEKHPPCKGAIARKWSLLVENKSDEVINSFITQPNEWKHLMNRDAEKVRSHCAKTLERIYISR